MCVLSITGFAGGKKKEVKKETGLGLSNKKSDNFGEWYSEVFFTNCNFLGVSVGGFNQLFVWT